MDNESKLRDQIRHAIPNARIALILHERGCTGPCRCDVRATVHLRQKANTRTGWKMTHHLVRLDKNAPEPEPFVMPEREPELPPVPEVKHESFPIVLPVGDTPLEPPKPKRKRGRPRKQRPRL